MGDHNVVWVTNSEVTSYGPESDLPADFGAKARGLLWLPPAWVPHFFVIAPEVHRHFATLTAANRLPILEQISAFLDEALGAAEIGRESKVLLRSNAVRETLRERGRYVSKATEATAIAANLPALYDNFERASPGESIGVIVQAHVPAIVKGHLSNERRVAEEYRDGLIEFEDATGEITERRISFRQWRSSRRANEGSLACTSQRELANVLRQLLALSAQRTKRVHFEWVWDGKFVHAVQADLDDEHAAGTNPEATLRGRAAVQIDATALSCFSPVSPSASTATGKLRNHAIYASHGFWQPTFYQMSNGDVIERILRGEHDSSLESDLRLLTAMPLVIRTSCTSATIPLLPRSNQLTTAEQAMRWLHGEFADKIRERQIEPGAVSLLAHHYIPAKVAAYSTGSAERLDVYVEALWGIPEGLYYYPFDSYTVQTVGAEPVALTDKDYGRFEIVKKLRYKSHFVAPNADGQFVCHELGQPWDWKQTVDDMGSLHRMAAFTRKLAAQEGHTVSVMWFIACVTVEGRVDLIPWYHERLNSVPTESQFRRNARDEVLTLSTEKDLEELEIRALSGPSKDMSRLVLNLSPVEDQAIRNEGFARRVGTAAKRLNAVVTLNGASLSHIYYVLSRTGAEIAVRNIADIASRREVHEKLVRDKIPATVAASGEVAHVASLNKEETIAALRIKLVEEAFEVRDASREGLIEELADVLEVLKALASASGHQLEEVDRVRRQKADRRGGFQEGIVLITTGSEESPRQDSPLLPNAEPTPTRVIISENAPPLERVRAGAADVRNTSDFIEFVQNGSVSLTHTEWTIEASRRLLLPPNSSVDYLDWSIDGQRKGGTLKLRLKIRIGNSQLELPLEQSDEEIQGDDVSSESSGEP